MTDARRELRQILIAQANIGYPLERTIDRLVTWHARHRASGALTRNDVDMILLQLVQDARRQDWKGFLPLTVNAYRDRLLALATPTEPQAWCTHIAWTRLSEQSSWTGWVVTARSPWSSVPEYWTVCPICGQPRPEGRG